VKIILDQVGKKFVADWVFRDLSLEINPGDRLAILGSNGSGKTTLIKMLSGSVMPTEGRVTYQIGERIIAVEDIYRDLTFVAPYFELIEEFTLLEMMDFYQKFKTFKSGMNSSDCLTQAGLAAHAKKKVSDCSSGMKQKLKLALGLFSQTSLLLLDEPCTNLDAESINWYTRQIAALPASLTIVVCSNHIEAEVGFCGRSITMKG
jgi:ABC-type multidrug transport system ATPase subunit